MTPDRDVPTMEQAILTLTELCNNLADTNASLTAANSLLTKECDAIEFKARALQARVDNFKDSFAMLHQFFRDLLASLDETTNALEAAYRTLDTPALNDLFRAELASSNVKDGFRTRSRSIIAKAKDLLQ